MLSHQLQIYKKLTTNNAQNYSKCLLLMELLLSILAGYSLIINDATGQPGRESSNQGFEYVSFFSQLKVKISHNIHGNILKFPQYYSSIYAKKKMPIMPALRSMLRLYHYAQNYAGIMRLTLKLRRFYDVSKIKPKFTRFLFTKAQLQLDNSISHFMIKFHKRLFLANTFNSMKKL